MTDTELNMHGVAVAAGEHGLLILGESGSGKSSLAARMMAEWPFARVSLVADDRVLLSRRHGRLIARPHPAIAGRMEIRGHDLVAAPHLDAVVLRGVLRLGAEPLQRLPEPMEMTFRQLDVTLPLAVLPTGYAAYARLLQIWPYFRVTIGKLGSNIGAAP